MYIINLVFFVMPKLHKHKNRSVSKTPKSNKISKVMREFYHHKLHSGSKQGPVVTNVHQAQVCL